MKEKLDNIIVGLLAGGLFPILGMYIYFLFTYRSQTTFTGFIDYFSRMHIVVASISLACYISNLPLFFGMIWLNMNKAARGVLIATMVYTGWVVYEKFIA